MKLAGIGALTLALVASVARADAPADLPLDQVMALLHAIGVDSAWSITQWPSDHSPGLWGIEAYSGKNAPTPGVCTTKYIQIGVSERDGKLVLVERGLWRTQYAFSKCGLSFAKDFYDIVGVSDLATLERLRKDLAIIKLTFDGAPSADVKVTFQDSESKGLFATGIREGDIDSVYANKNGSARFCFFTRQKDILDAPETLGVEIVPGKVTELKVDICGAIE